MKTCKQIGFAVLLMLVSNVSATETWRGLIVQPENRCAPYDRSKDYRYSQRVERQIIRNYGAIYGPYTGRYFSSPKETDIEHIVATSEAHDSGLCAADSNTKRRFAEDLLNLTLASPKVNRHEKRGKDAGEWMPKKNRCWFAHQIVLVKRKYGMTVDIREARALESVLSGCASTKMIMQ